MTPPDGAKLQKTFEMRRAGLLPEDPRADADFVALLVVVESAALGAPTRG